MPCMGPSYNHSMDQGKLVYDDVIKLLKENYGISRPTMINGTKIEADMQKEWDENAHQLLKVLQELVWIDACSTW